MEPEAEPADEERPGKKVDDEQTVSEGVDAFAQRAAAAARATAGRPAPGEDHDPADGIFFQFLERT